MTLHHRGFPIRKSADRSLFAAPRSLSQLIASFFGSWCQGIHLMLLFAWTFCFGHLTFAVLWIAWVSSYIFRFAVKSFAFSPFLLFVLFRFRRSSTRRNCFLPYFSWKTNISQYYVLNICSFLLFHFYSVFNEHGFAWTVGDLFLVCAFIPSGDTETISEISTRFLATGSAGLVGTSGLEPPTSRLSGARSNHLSYAPIG